MTTAWMRGEACVPQALHCQGMQGNWDKAGPGTRRIILARPHAPVAGNLVAPGPICQAPVHLGSVLTPVHPCAGVRRGQPGGAGADLPGDVRVPGGALHPADGAAAGRAAAAGAPGGPRFGAVRDGRCLLAPSAALPLAGGPQSVRSMPRGAPLSCRHHVTHFGGACLRPASVEAKPHAVMCHKGQSLQRHLLPCRRQRARRATQACGQRWCNRWMRSHVLCAGRAQRRRCARGRPINRILLAQRITLPQMWVSVAVLVLHVGANWLLIHRLGLGYLGAAWATSLVRHSLQHFRSM